MATTIPFDNGLKTCPYNRHHKVKISRFQQHLSSCAKHYPHIKLEECPFNVCHRIPSAEMDAHMIQCPDNRRIIRSIFETHGFKVEKKGKKDETLAEEDEDDPWAEEYIDKDQMSVKNYDILSKGEITAEWVFNERFGNKDEKNFTDTLFIQKMSYEERKKYQAMCVKRIKDNKQQGIVDEGSLRPAKSDDIDFEENEVKKQKTTETANDSIRKPKSVPFTGIGRGRTRGGQEFIDLD